jgi:fibro-slime domain-containing protein
MVKKVNVALTNNGSCLCSIPMVLIALVFLTALFSRLSAQTYPPTIRIPVTYYDYHADGSNPEFEKSPTGTGTHLGMVADTLDAQRKPVLGPVPYWNCYIAKWFRPWQSGDFTIPNYTNPVTTTCSNPDSTVNYDTAFTNMVFQDTLIFTLVPGSAGTYQYTNAAFFPLDGRGFGADEPAGSGATNHNYSFTMELHWQFVKVQGLTFQFAGDDDVWAFINNRLVMDIGGIHNTTNGSVSVDSLGLTNEKGYMFDFFFCERHRTGSDIMISTNLFTSAAAVKIYAVTPPNYSDTTHPINNIATGSVLTPFNLTAHVFDSTGAMRPEYDSLITWTITYDSLGSTITKQLGDSTALVSPKAFGLVTLTASYKNPSDPNSPTIIKTVQIYIGPGKPNHIDIQSSPVITSLRSDQRVDSITLNENTPQYSNLYAVLRDSLGDYIDSANNATWTSTDITIATIAPGPKNWQGIVTKVKAGKIFIIASAPGVIPDTVAVTLLTRKIESFVAATPAHNPAGPKNPIQEPNVINFYHNVLQNSGNPSTVNGALVGIQSRVPLSPRTSGSVANASYGDAVVYDAVGNVVAKDLHVYYVAALDSAHISYGIYWDCHNQYGRWVGNGTYLIMVSTTDANQTTKTTPIKVGFNR